MQQLRQIFSYLSCTKLNEDPFRVEFTHKTEGNTVKLAAAMEEPFIVKAP
jgi:hypothetical protein